MQTGLDSGWHRGGGAGWHGRLLDGGEDGLSVLHCEFAKSRLCGSPGPHSAKYARLMCIDFFLRSLARDVKLSAGVPLYFGKTLKLTLNSGLVERARYFQQMFGFKVSCHHLLIYSKSLTFEFSFPPLQAGHD